MKRYITEKRDKYILPNGAKRMTIEDIEAIEMGEEYDIYHNDSEKEKSCKEAVEKKNKENYHVVFGQTLGDLARINQKLDYKKSSCFSIANNRQLDILKEKWINYALAMAYYSPESENYCEMYDLYKYYDLISKHISTLILNTEGTYYCLEKTHELLDIYQDVLRNGFIPDQAHFNFYTDEQDLIDWITFIRSVPGMIEGEGIKKYNDARLAVIR